MIIKRAFYTRLLATFTFIMVFMYSPAKTRLDGVILYAVVLKEKPVSTNMSNYFRQPDSNFYLIAFNSHNSFHMFSEKNKIPGDQELDSLKPYLFANRDSGFIIKVGDCNNYYKTSLRSEEMIDSKKTVTLMEIPCSVRYSINEFQDTTLYYVTNRFPKSAGVIMFSNVDECVIGFEDKLRSILPRSFRTTTKQVTFHPDENIKMIQSAKEIWVDGAYSSILAGKPFPKFSAKDIHLVPVNNDSLLSHRSVFIVLDHLVACRTNYLDVNKMVDIYNEDNTALLKALDEISKEKKATGYLITEDYREIIPANLYPHLHIITNGEKWRQKMQIYDSPNIIVVNSSGIVTRYSDNFELDPHVSLKEALIQLLK